MYTPNYFRGTDPEQAFQFVQQYPFATLVRVLNGQASASHLPFVIEKRAEHWVLSSHMAAINPLAADLDGAELLVIFQEPHAYISPTLYDKKENVPTWNYVAVHCTGRARLLEGREAQESLLMKMIRVFEPDYAQQFKQEVSERYKAANMKAIVAFEMVVDKLEYATKLSQNKTAAERTRIAEALQNSNDSTINNLGKLM